MEISDEQRADLIERALQARQSAYAPYSEYAVGAALLTSSGRVFTGANVENAAYPVSICAERVAVFKAVTEAERRFSAIAIATDNGGSPCGSCRQVLSEFGLETQVLMVDKNGTVVRRMSVGDLLPAAFRPSDLA
jgi:cytidine deaminase